MERYFFKDYIVGHARETQIIPLNFNINIHKWNLKKYIHHG